MNSIEEIIQRLLDERHITVKEAMQMLKALIKNELSSNLSKDYVSPYTTRTVMYGSPGDIFSSPTANTISKLDE